MGGRKPTRREVVWTEKLAYGVGLMATDGTLSIDGRHLECTSKDKEQVENLQKCFGITANIKMKSAKKGEEKKYYRIQWGDVVLYRFLLEVGLMPNKSLEIDTLSIPDEYFFDFLRGVYDGDGCFYSYRDPRWKNSFMHYLVFLSGSSDHINWLQKNLERLAGVTGHKTSAKERELYQIRYAKKEGLVLIHHMYRNTQSICLKRKRLKIEHALRIVGESLRKS